MQGIVSPGSVKQIMLHTETARDNSCVITIVGYHGNSVYRVIALIPVSFYDIQLYFAICSGTFRRMDC
jgi:hypothetical protein